MDDKGGAGAQGEGAVSSKLTRDQIEAYLQEVGAHLDARSLIGEILITGGAFMTAARPEDRDDLLVLKRRSRSPAAGPARARVRAWDEVLRI